MYGVRAQRSHRKRWLRPYGASRRKTSRLHMASAVPRKGPGREEPCQQHMLFKRDGEPPVVDIVNNLDCLRADFSTFIENFLVGATTFNGVIESGVWP